MTLLKQNLLTNGPSFLLNDTFKNSPFVKFCHFLDLFKVPFFFGSNFVFDWLLICHLGRAQQIPHWFGASFLFIFNHAFLEGRTTDLSQHCLRSVAFKIWQ